MTSLDLLALLNAVASRARSDAVEAERRRIGAELHDQVGQDLTYALLSLAVLERDLPDALRPTLEAATSQLRAALGDLGRLAAGLRPSVLDELGLAAALRGLAAEASGTTGLPTGLATGLGVETSIGDVGGLSPDQQLAVYRVAQEAVTNVVRHARATRLELTGGRDSDQVIVRVRDDGRWLQRPPGQRPPELGLAGMAERAALAGGRLEIVTGGGGTTVTLRIPVTSREEEHHDA